MGCDVLLSLLDAIYKLFMGAEPEKIKYFDGSIYEGELNADRKEHGQGRITFGNKDVLEGKFEDG